MNAFSTIKAPLIPEWIQVIPFAVVITFALFALMERLVASGDANVDDGEVFVIPKVTWEEPPIIEVRTKEVKKVDEPLEPPELPEDIDVIDGNPGEITIPKISLNLGNGIKSNFSNSSRMPLAKLLARPNYPRIAIARNIEGYVDVRFDINERGQTENIEILAAVPEGVFEKAALKAVRKWRYQPSTNNGKPERFIGMKQRVRFEMQK